MAVTRIARAPIIESGDYFVPRMQNEWGLMWVTVIGALTYAGTAYWLSRKLKVPLARR